MLANKRISADPVFIVEAMTTTSNTKPATTAVIPFEMGPPRTLNKVVNALDIIAPTSRIMLATGFSASPILISATRESASDLLNFASIVS